MGQTQGGNSGNLELLKQIEELKEYIDKTKVVTEGQYSTIHAQNDVTKIYKKDGVAYLTIMITLVSDAAQYSSIGTIPKEFRPKTNVYAYTSYGSVGISPEGLTTVMGSVKAGSVLSFSMSYIAKED